MVFRIKPSFEFRVSSSVFQTRTVIFNLAVPVLTRNYLLTKKDSEWGFRYKNACLPTGTLEFFTVRSLQQRGNMKNLDGKVAIVTGSSSGIGRAIAERMALDGASVVVNYGSSVSKAKEVVAGIEGKGGRAVAIQADMSQVSEIRRMFQEAIDQFDRIDIVVSNAGMFSQTPFDEVNEQDFDLMFALNAKGTFFTLQEAGRRVSMGGRIIYISTSATAMSFPGAQVYKGSKAAGEQFVNTLAKELGSRNITVNTVSPGFTETDMLPTDETFREMGMKMSPFGRLGLPEDIADVVAFLVSDQGRWITGNTIQAGGGVV